MEETVEKEVMENGQDEAILSQEDVAGLDESGQKIYNLVKEVTDLFKSRIASGEITAFDAAEALAVALSGTVYSTIVPHQLQEVSRETDYLVNRTLSTFDKQTTSKKMMFASQMLAGAKIATYITSHGNKVIQNYEANKTAAAEKTIQELEEKVSE